MSRSKQVFISALLTIAVMVAMFGALSFQAVAQDGGDPTPVPDGADDGHNRNAQFYSDPEEITGDAEWTFGETTFVSNYPDGFEFTAKATSSGGAIVNASIQWSHAPGFRSRRAATYDPATERFVYNWDHDNSVPPWAAVNYRWLFTDEAENSFLSAWVLGEEYEDNNREWRRYENDDIIAFVEGDLPDETGPQTLTAMEAQRETFRQAWGDLLSYKPRAILFATRESFGEWRRGSGNPNVIGITNPEWGGIVQRVSGGDIIDLAWGTVLHEVGHLYQDDFAPAGFFAGTWWIEGNATFFELSQQYDYELRVRNIAASGQLPALMAGAGPNPSGTGPDGIGRYGYDIGYTFFKWLVENYGIDAHRQIIEILGPSMSYQEAITEITGMPIEEVEMAWRIWLGADPIPPTLIPTPELRFPPTVTPFQFPTSSSEE